MTARYDFTNQVAVVTGGARGIGLAIARRLHRDGAAIAVWDFDAEAGEAAAAELGGRAAAFAVDVTDYVAVEAALAATEARLGPGLDPLQQCRHRGPRPAPPGTIRSRTGTPSSTST